MDMIEKLIEEFRKISIEYRAILIIIYCIIGWAFVFPGEVISKIINSLALNMFFVFLVVSIETKRDRQKMKNVWEYLYSTLKNEKTS